MGTYKTAALTRPPPAKSSPCAMVAPLPAASPTARRQQRRDDAPCCLRQCAAPHHRAIRVPGASSARIAHPVGSVRQSLEEVGERLTQQGRSVAGPFADEQGL